MITSTVITRLRVPPLTFHLPGTSSLRDHVRQQKDDQEDHDQDGDNYAETPAHRPSPPSRSAITTSATIYPLGPPRNRVGYARSSARSMSDLVVVTRLGLFFLVTRQGASSENG